MVKLVSSNPAVKVKITVFKNKTGSWTVVVPDEFADGTYTSGRYIRDTFESACYLVFRVLERKMHKVKAANREKDLITRATG